MGLIPKLPKMPKVIPAMQIYGITERAVLSEIDKLPATEQEKVAFMDRALKLPRGASKVWTYQKQLKALLHDISASGGDVNRINEEIEQNTK